MIGNKNKSDAVFNCNLAEAAVRVVEVTGAEFTGSDRIIWEPLSTGNWDVSNSGYEVMLESSELSSVATEYTRLAFENRNGEDYFSLYTEDNSRLSCSRK